jgi:hypothetical protein
MARRSLKPQLNQIRTWVRQGRTDAWVAHQLEVSVRDVQAFKREHELAPADAEADGAPRVDEEPDLRAEDDALVAAALDAEPEPEEEVTDEGSDDESAAGARRRRGRRGGRRRRGGGASKPLEGTFDHGEEGYGLWLDPSLQDDPVYAEHWAGHRPVTVVVEAERIVIERAGEAEEPEEEPAETSEPELDPDRFDA